MKTILRFFRRLILTLLLCVLAVMTLFVLSPETGRKLLDFAESLRKEAEDVIETIEPEDIPLLSDQTEIQTLQNVYEFDELYYPYYGMLNENQQLLYQQVYEQVLAMNAEIIPAVTVSEDEASEAVMSLIYDHPELFWLDTAFSYQYTESHVCTRVEMVFNDTAENIEEARTLFEKSADEIISEAMNYSSDYDKEKYVHDALLDLIDYDTVSSNNQSAYSALVNHDTVCAGYAKAFQYIMTRLGIPAYYVSGYAEGEHAWNIVLLDGEFYNVDLTWDDGSWTKYGYFNVPDSIFLQTHERTGLSVNLPVCRGTAYSSLEGTGPAVDIPDMFRNPGQQPQNQGAPQTMPQGPQQEIPHQKGGN